MLTTQSRYLIRHNIPLFHITVSLKHTNSLSLFLFGKHLLTYLPLILRNQAIGSTNNGLSGTVILFQLEHFRIRINLRKIQNIINIRSPERVNALSIVAYHTYTLTLFGKLEHDTVLGIIRILILIYQHIAKLLTITCQYLRKITE